MDNKSYNVAKLSNAFSTGSGGANFERHIQAVFVLSLLVDGFSPIIDAPIERLEFQAKHLGYDVDDLVVISSTGTKLLCQMKRSLAITKSDVTFQEVLTAAWSDFKKDSFNTATDKIALITSFISKESIYSLRYIHDQALAASSADTFIDRIYQPKFTAQDARDRFEVIKNCLQKANDNAPLSNENLWKFCRCFTLSIFDLDYEDSINRILAQSLIHCKTEKDAKLVWGNLADFCGTWNQQAATITRDNIPREILELFGHKKKENLTSTISAEFMRNGLWAALALVGTWDENNEYDVHAIEKITGEDYNDVQRECRKLLLNNTGTGELNLQNGRWEIKNKRAIIDSIRDFYFDNTVENAFQVANGFVREISKQFSEDGQFNIMIPASGRFNNSEGFRKGLVDGLCILANGAPLTNCTDNLLALESRKLICNALKDQNWTGLVSISNILSSLAEMNPLSYLECLEELVRCEPHEIEKLFPTKQGRSLIDQNFISNILFTLEQLAWHENYIIQCIRCLGELECLTYEQTNWANTPINTIVNILTPFLPQTCASIEKQKNAVQALKIDHADLYWDVLVKLLPKAGTITVVGTSRPKYLGIKIPEEISITNEDRFDLFQYYIQQAVSMAKSDSAKLMQLLEHTSYMEYDDILLLLEKINAASLLWDDEEKCNVWIKLCELKFQAVQENEGTPPDTDLFKELCKTIETVCPKNILYLHRRLYLSHYNEFLFDENRWEELEQSKQAAVEEIYQTLGLNSVIEFGKSVNSLYEIGSRLGRAINVAEFSGIIPEYRSGNNATFFSNLTKAFVAKNGVSVIQELELKTEEPSFIARLLKDAPFVQELINIVPEYLPENEALFWETVDVPPCYAGYCDYNIVDVIHTLLLYHRAPAAIYAVGQGVEKLDIDVALLCDILTQAPADKDATNIHQYSVRKIIKHLQNSGKIDINTLSDIEYIYLPWLDEHSPIKPRAINYRLANEPEYFCSVIESMYKKRHESTSARELPPAVRERLFQLTYRYRIIPGTDWNGVFHDDRFSSWLATVKAWSIENDRYEVTMHTIGEGLSYAKFNDNGIIDVALMTELNAIDNDELRKGYRLGIFNQRGVHWIDPEGKPEKELAQKYNHRADTVESLGYSRFSGLLRKIAEGYLSEAQENSKHYRFGDE